tara:strand:- start:1575 stop:1733 length:159 start_codon:yes stop_codon:yes gene_type:complete
MTARISPEMLKALELIKQGLTPYAAAKAVGIEQSTISRSRLYKDWIASINSK